MTYEEVLADFERQKSKHLTMSLALDALGMASYIIPFFGEFVDIIYAPIYGITIYTMYRLRGVSATIGGTGGFLEELFFGDIIPTASVMWTYHYYLKRESTLKKFVDMKMKEKNIIEERIHYHSQPKRPNLLIRIGTSIRNLFSPPALPPIETSPYEDAAIDLDGFKDDPDLELPPVEPMPAPRDEDYV